jgi:hypothetical protein
MIILCSRNIYPQDTVDGGSVPLGFAKRGGLRG